MRLARVALLWATAMTLTAATRPEIVEGNPASPVKVVIYEDLQCGDCRNFRALLDEKLLPKYGARVAFVHRDFPLGRHDWARPAAIAGRWIATQSTGLAIIYQRELYAEQNNITLAGLKPWLAEFAVRNHLDSKAIVASLSDPVLTAAVDQDLQSARGRGIARAPTVFIGSASLVETIVYDDIARAIDEAIPH